MFAELDEKLKAAGIIRALIKIGECVFDQRQYDSSHGFESLDPIGQEAFVNHIHLAGETAALDADQALRPRQIEPGLRQFGMAGSIKRAAERLGEGQQFGRRHQRADDRGIEPRRGEISRAAASLRSISVNSSTQPSPVTAETTSLDGSRSAWSRRASLPSSVNRSTLFNTSTRPP